MNNNISTPNIPSDIDELLRDGSTAARFLTDARKSIENKNFVKEIDWDPANASTYLEILESMIRSFAPSSKLDQCKIEAFKDVYILYKIYVDSWNEQNPGDEYKPNIDMKNRWEKGVQELISLNRMVIHDDIDLFDYDFDVVCEIVYLAIFKEEIEPLLTAHNLCKCLDIPFYDYEAIKLETLTAIYDYYEWYVREMGYSDGDFETPECQEFFMKWKMSMTRGQ